MRGAVLLAVVATVLDAGSAWSRTQANSASEKAGKPAPVTGQATASGDTDSPGRRPHILKFRVVDARTKAPLSAVSIVVRAIGAERPSALATDEEGRCRVVIPRQVTQFLGISVRKEGFVPIRVEWNGPEIVPVLPDAYTLALKPGTQIGGRVRDTRGRPVAGAGVYVLLVRDRFRPEREHIFLEDGYHVETDARGSWRCTMMPADLGANDLLQFRLIHPDYVSELIEWERTLPVEQLRAMTSVMVMEDGIPLIGRIVDSGGRPVVGAQVLLHNRGFTIHPELLTPEEVACVTARTDADGRYRFGHVQPGERRVTVEAPGYASGDERVTVGANSGPAEIRLKSQEEVEEAARAARLVAEQKLEAEERAGPNDIPERWVVTGAVIVGAVVGLIGIVSRWIRGARGRKVLSDE